jgi:DNA-binding protein H-NS
VARRQLLFGRRPFSLAASLHLGLSFISQTIYMHRALLVALRMLALGKESKMQLKSMSLDRLIGLRDKVDAVLSAKVKDERRSLEAELMKLGRFNGGRSISARTGLKDRRTGSVAPKYWNPDDSTETWAGRGLKPRWLAAAIKAGKRLDDFLIAGSTSSKSNGQKKAAKKKK